MKILANVRRFARAGRDFDPNVDYYAVMGVAKNADSATIKKAYYKLAQQHHPDLTGRTGETLKKINVAYGVLSDKDKRRSYDASRGSSTRTHQDTG